MWTETKNKDKKAGEESDHCVIPDRNFGSQIGPFNFGPGQIKTLTLNR